MMPLLTAEHDIVNAVDDTVACIDVWSCHSRNMTLGILNQDSLVVLVHEKFL
jgi:hypothetical protein